MSTLDWLPDRLRALSKMRSLHAGETRQVPDYGALTTAALNKHTSSPEFTARYKAWLEYLGPDLWTPVAKADMEAMLAEEAKIKK